MRSKHLLYILSFLFIIQSIYAQRFVQPDPEQRIRLQRYVTDNHLYTGSEYIYFDTVTKRYLALNTADYTILNDRAPQKRETLPAANTIIEANGAFHLVKDVNALTDASIDKGFYIDKGSNSFTVLNNVSYFVADDGIHGRELWRSDGTAAGTYLVKDIAAGEASAKPFSMTVSGANIYFGVPDSTYSKYTLWKTDGTAAGTVPIKDFAGADNPWASKGILSNLCDVNGTLYFVMSDKKQWDQLWKSDGTEAGTIMVKDFNTVGGNNVRSLISLNGLLYFIGVDSTHGAEIWRSNGTDAGTYMIKDINPSIYNSYPNYPVNLTSYNGKLYFAEIDEHNESKLWVTDGTGVGTTPVINPSGILVDPYYYGDNYTNIPFIISNNLLYFSGMLNSTGTELFKYDITNERISLIKDIVPGTGSIRIVWRGMRDVNDAVFFAITDSLGIHLYRTKGTANTTSEIKTFRYSWEFGNMVNGNGKLYFTATDSLTNDEPWISDGTAAGTKTLKEIYPGAIGSTAACYTACNGNVLFTATDNIHGSELWTTNGNKTQLLKDINITATTSSGVIDIYSSYRNTPVAAFKNGVLTSASTYNKGAELYKASITTEGLVKDIVPGILGSNAHNLKAKGDTCYFVAQAPVSDTTKLGGIYVSAYYLTNEAIFKTDGTAAGTVQVSPQVGYTIYDFAVTEDGTIFFGIFGSNGDELWKTNGTKSGTVLLKSNILFTKSYMYDAWGNPHIFKVIGNIVYFSAYEYIGQIYSHGTELWKSDGTVNGTIIIKDINQGFNSADPSQLTVFNNQLYFAAYDGADTALWKTDGTSAGTIKIKSIKPTSLVVSNNTLFFNGYNNTTGAELWKTNGTTAGTVLVKDINTGVNSSNPAHLADVNGTLYFSASDSTRKTQLWKSNGSKAGTQLVKNIAPVTDTLMLAYFTSVGGKLFFTVNNKLWVSNGTGKGTGLLSDNVLEDLLAYNLTANNNQLFFEGYNYKYGYELYAGDVSGGAALVAKTFIKKTDTSIIAAQSKDKPILLYPNPAKDILTVKLNNHSGNVTIAMYNAVGKKVNAIRQGVEAGGTININVASLHAGVYVLKINIDNTVVQQKFIKQ